VRRIIIKSVMLALIISLVAVRPALAYIDPNTGGLLFQVLATALALFSGVALIFSRQIRMAFARARRFLRSLLNRGDLQAQDAPVNPQSADTPIEAD
jgi:hypothetical protein